MNLKIRNLIIIRLKEVKYNTICFTPKTQKWCSLPYPGHPNGCPNYNKSEFCPPNVPFLKCILNNFNYFYLIYAKFDLKKYKNLMLDKHPYWTEKQATCVLYWQNSIKKILKDFIKKIFIENPKNNFYLFSSGSGYKCHIFKQNNIYSMEATGINVIKTLKDNDINFEIKPKNFVLLVNLLCAREKIRIP